MPELLAPAGNMEKLKAAGNRVTFYKLEGGGQ